MNIFEFIEVRSNLDSCGKEKYIETCKFAENHGYICGTALMADVANLLYLHDLFEKRKRMTKEDLKRYLKIKSIFVIN